MSSELDNWMEWIENSMADEAFDAPMNDDLENFVGGVSCMASRAGPLVQQSGLRISTDLILRVQVVYVIGLFLVGKHRKKVQRKLAELHLIPGMNELFEQFIWKCQA
jgi:Trpc4-associated protein